jgi:hypothetical protein
LNRVAWSSLSGRNSCEIVNTKGECLSECLPPPFSDIWHSFVKVNTRYDEAKQRYEAYSLEEVVKLLEANDQGDSLLERELFLLRHDNLALRQELQDTNKAMENMRSTLLKAYLECKREVLADWYADYCRKQEEGKRELDSLNLQKQQLKQQLRTGEINNKFYQHQLTPLKKRISDLKLELKFGAKKELSELLPGVIHPLGDSGYITFDEVVEFVKGKNPEQKE